MLCKEVCSKLKKDKLSESINEARKNPSFIKELNKFIKASTEIYKLE